MAAYSPQAQRNHTRNHTRAAINTCFSASDLSSAQVLVAVSAYTPSETPVKLIDGLETTSTRVSPGSDVVIQYTTKRQLVSMQML